MDKVAVDGLRVSAVTTKGEQRVTRRSASSRALPTSRANGGTRLPLSGAAPSRCRRSRSLRVATLPPHRFVGDVAGVGLLVLDDPQVEL